MRTLKDVNAKNAGQSTVIKQMTTQCVFILMAILLSMHLFAQNRSAERLMNELGPENSSLLAMVGNWDVTETVWNSPAATPEINTKYVRRKPA